jgi:hypothetical protein
MACRMLCMMRRNVVPCDATTHHQTVTPHGAAVAARSCRSAACVVGVAELLPLNQHHRLCSQPAACQKADQAGQVQCQACPICSCVRSEVAE